MLNLHSRAGYLFISLCFHSCVGSEIEVPPDAGNSNIETQASTSRYAYGSYQSSIYCSPSSPMLYPSSVKEIQQIIRDAVKNGDTVKPIGSRHSLTDVICTDGIPMSMLNINYTVLNDDGTATAGGGAEMKDVLEFLHSYNRTLIHVPTFGGITVAGAIGTGAHGSSLLHPPSLSDQVVRLTVVDGLGEMRVIDDPADINAFRVHLGMLSVIVDVTLQTVPLFKMTVKNSLLPEQILLNGTALQWAHQYDWFEMWWFPSNKVVVVSKGNYTYDLETPGNATTNLIPDQTSSDIHSARDAFETLQGTRNRAGLLAIQDFTQYSLYQDVVGKPPFYTVDGKTLQNPATGFVWQLQSNKCTNRCPWDNRNNSINPEESSMAFEVNELPEVIKSMKSILRLVPATFTMIGVFIRFSRESDALMAISNGRPTVTVEWATPMRRDPFELARDGIGAYQAILQTMVKRHNGRPHWGKNGLYYSNPEIIGATAPNRNTFISFMKKYDPNGTFLNKFGKRLLDMSKEIDMHPKVTRCALQDYCVCSKNSDCAALQQCQVVNGCPVCNDVASVLLPLPGGSSMRNYNPKNLTSIHEAILSHSVYSENGEEM